MCLAIPGQIVKLLDEDNHFAVVEVSGVQRKVNVDLLRDRPAQTGDWVLIHVGFAMSRISEHEAQEQLQLLEEIGEAQSALEEMQDPDLTDKEDE